MEPVGADANFRSEAELAAVIEPRARIHHHSCRVNGRCEKIRSLEIVRDDVIRVVRAILLNVLHGTWGVK